MHEELFSEETKQHFYGIVSFCLPYVFLIVYSKNQDKYCDQHFENFLQQKYLLLHNHTFILYTPHLLLFCKNITLDALHHPLQT